MIKNRQHVPSATCLTGGDSQMMQNFKAFDSQSRVNKFKAEDFYFIRN